MVGAAELEAPCIEGEVDPVMDEVLASRLVQYSHLPHGPVLMAVVLLCLLFGAAPARATVFDVNTTSDIAAPCAPGTLSLRCAVSAANAAGGTNTINVPAGNYMLSLTGPGEDANQTGDLDITNGDLTIAGDGSSTTTVRGPGSGPDDRIFDVVSGSSAGAISMTGMTISFGGGVSDGAGIQALAGSLSLDQVVVDSNTTTDGGFGGGVFYSPQIPGSLTVTSSTFIDNTAAESGTSGGGFGGGISFEPGPGNSTLTVTDSTFQSNVAQSGSTSGGGFGGAIEVEPAGVVTATVTGSTFDTNTAAGSSGQGGFGGALYVDPSDPGSTFDMTNSTLNGNSAGGPGGFGGGMDLESGTSTLRNVTIAGNDAPNGGGFYNNNADGAATFANSIVANNGASDCDGSTVNDVGENLDSDNTCGFAEGGQDPNLAPLADNGGPTKTMALQSPSPAIDAGANGSCASVDQRGAPRPVDGDGNSFAICDLGAYEFGSTPGGGSPFDVNTTADPAPPCAPGTVSLRCAVIAANQTAGTQTINVPAGDYQLANPGAGEDQALTGDLDITEGVTIAGAGAGSTTVRATPGDRIFNAVSGAGTDTLTISGLTLTDAVGVGDGAAIWADAGTLNVNDDVITGNSTQPGTDGNGGGVYFTSDGVGTLAITNTTFSSNTAGADSGGSGGAVSFNPGAGTSTFTVTDSTFDSNVAASAGGSATGGAIELTPGSSVDATFTRTTFVGNAAEAPGSGSGGGTGGAVNFRPGSGSTLTVTDSTFDSNTAQSGGTGGGGRGGALRIGSSGAVTTTMSGSTFVDNFADGPPTTGGGLGGAVDVDPTDTGSPLDISNSTFNGNNANGPSGFGGAIEFESGTATLTNVTIAGNTVGSSFGGGFDNTADDATSANSIIANNTGQDCGSNPVTDVGENLDSDGTCGFALTPADPNLAALADNGGPTRTMALQSPSPAIDAGDNGSCAGTDQRGFARPIDGDGDTVATCDLGAFELGAGPPAPPPSGGGSTTSSGGGSAPAGGTTTTTTAPSGVAAPISAPPPPPGPGGIPIPFPLRTGNITPVSGIIRVRLPDSLRFVRIETLTSIPVGTLIDATHGVVLLTVARDLKGHLQTGQFSRGAFYFNQLLENVRVFGSKPPRTIRKLVTALRMARGVGKPKSCPLGSSGRIPAGPREDRSKFSRKRFVRYLQAKASGNFQVIGRHSSGLERGTSWLTRDDCTGTFTRVQKGQVVVTDYAKLRDVLVKAGRSYLATGRP